MGAGNMRTASVGTENGRIGKMGTESVSAENMRTEKVRVEMSIERVRSSFAKAAEDKG